MKTQLGGGDGSKGGNSNGNGPGDGPGAKIAAAAKVCQAQGLKPDTDAFRAVHEGPTRFDALSSERLGAR